MQENIDMIKLEESFKKMRLPRYLKNKNNLFSMAFILLGETSGIMQGDLGIVLANIAAPVFLLKLFLSWKDKSYVRTEMSQVVRESLEYKECLKLYDDYLKRLAIFIRDLGYSNSKEIVFCLNTLLKRGALSQNGSNSYHNYKYDRIMTTELLGARVVSGKCVCRHYASFTADLFMKLGIVASPLMVRIENDVNPVEKLRNHFTVWTHSLVGIAEEDKKYLYDPTMFIIAGKSDFEFKNKADGSYVGKPMNIETDEYYLIYPGNKLFFNRTYKEISYAISALPMMDMDKKELDQLKSEVENAIAKRDKDIKYFAMSNRKLMEEIAKLEAAISPHSDKPIKEWKLTKNK